ncbi:hypothetical protein [Fuerstiella marisgermanici]|uniref:DUF1559 domain-containing protein n=1 Tax=Fuerstiella marisgermanici TaxID=1891926 RepID=A0A1P8WLX0_9PLAN|nr:hypothetical protein [Fuerstiella marisgermanici]APZ95037.1 hypothetical protein Fuma_04689 [Fuerstiella marisgermanici]
MNESTAKVIKRFALLAGSTVCLTFAGFYLQAIPWGRSSRDAIEGRAIAEIEQLSSSVSAFAADYGRKPLSHITLWEDGTKWQSDPLSRAMVRRLWPRFVFDVARDLNGDGDTVDKFHLSGAECLVWFLGGVQTRQGECIGFCHNPFDPFHRSSYRRTAPYFGFKKHRMTDLDSDGFPEYTDRLTDMPYLYIAKEAGRYHARDLAVFPEGDNRNMQHPYSFAGDSFGHYQIISAGFDREYGVGGEYSDSSDFTVERRSEDDNLTSFSNGRL